MISEVSKKALQGLILKPEVIGPIAAGLTSFMLSWAVDGSATMNLVGLVGILVGVGIYATKALFFKKEILQNAIDEIQEEKLCKQEEELNILDEKLVKTRDSTDQKLLRELRSVYTTFKEDLKSGRLTDFYTITDTVEKMFHACVQQLEQSYRIWDARRTIKGKEKKNLKVKRVEMLDEVESTIGQIKEAVNQLHTLNLDDSQVDLKSLNNQLDLKLKAALETEARMRGYDPDQELLKQEMKKL